jgi:25S rRNA (uracil2843-N3)-methyltransferase
MLNIYKYAFSSLLEGGADAIKPLLQEVKQALFERDFERAFGRQDYLEAYAFRWSPSRALCYVSLLADLEADLNDTILLRSVLHSKHFPPDKSSVVACLGGGAAEVVAFGGLLKYLMQTSTPCIPNAEEVPTTNDPTQEPTTIADQAQANQVGILLLDTAAWGDVIHQLSSTLTTPPPLSKYASASAKASNAPFLSPGMLKTTFQRCDLLSLSSEQLKASLGPKSLLITLLFTLNELYTSSITQTTAFLLNLTAAAAKGTVLLVVDSPGSYSEAAVGKSLKKYPMQWLMDRTLLGDQVNGHEDQGESEWEKLVGDESRWFRIAEGLKYSIPLENMRYQVHLYQRV